MKACLSWATLEDSLEHLGCYWILFKALANLSPPQSFDLFLTKQRGIAPVTSVLWSSPACTNGAGDEILPGCYCPAKSHDSQFSEMTSSALGIPEQI